MSWLVSVTGYSPRGIGEPGERVKAEMVARHAAFFALMEVRRAGEDFSEG